MKCIYCNSDKELTSSDIITYAITGAKLTKSFVCKTHNAFTNDNYILNISDGDYVDIIIDDGYYYAIDKISQTGTNSFFQYDDFDEYRYVVFDFWNTISYRVRICKSPGSISPNSKAPCFKVFLYHIDGRKTQCIQTRNIGILYN